MPSTLRRRALAMLLAAMTCGSASAQDPPPFAPAAVVAVTPDRIVWENLPAFPDGRQRALLAGRPEAGGSWTYRVRVPKPIRVEAHTHPVDEHVTVLEGQWSLGVGRRFEPSALVTYPPGSFVRIPAGTPHFIATGDGTVVIQASGAGVFATTPVE